MLCVTALRRFASFFLAFTGGGSVENLAYDHLLSCFWCFGASPSSNGDKGSVRFAARFGISRVAIFGSLAVARGEGEVAIVDIAVVSGECEADLPPSTYAKAK